jgi:thioredoxin-related protein
MMGGIMRIAVLFIILLFIAVTFYSNHNESEAATNTSEKLNWINLNSGLVKAKVEKKSILIDFYTDWCHWCKEMDKKTFNDKVVSQKLKDRFITVRINAESKTESASYQGKNYTNVELTQAFGVTGFPTLAFLTSDGEIITLIPGYVPAETFAYILDYVNQECYKKQMSFDEFMKRKGECDDKK